jgi:uncharacterized membrane protein YadS
MVHLPVYPGIGSEHVPHPPRSTLRRYSPLGKLGLTATLFLVGTSLSKRTITQVGFRPLLQGVVLWIIVGCVSLGAICYNLISI